jgi:hypothetical protein
MLAAMTVLDVMAAGVASGSAVEFRPSGSSMVPLIRSRQLVRVDPVDPARVEVGNIVLAKVAGKVYLYLVSAVDHGTGRLQISSNRGRVNGWTSHARVFGICTSVDGVRRPRIDGKLQTNQPLLRHKASPASATAAHPVKSRPGRKPQQGVTECKQGSRS